MDDTPQADGKTRNRTEKIAGYVIQLVAVVIALHIGQMWNDYAWYWSLAISLGAYVAIAFVAWIVYRAIEKVWAYSSRTK